MKAVLISIQPKWCEKIASGEKTLEVRKTCPKLETPFKCYIYCTLSGSKEFFRDTLNGDVAAWNRGKWSERKGMVIGEFVCDKVTPFDVPYPAFQKELDKTIMEQSCLTYYQLHRYAYHDCLYGWHISDLVIYDEPKELREFKPWKRECFYSDLGLAIPECRECHTCKVERPPQSWCYVEVCDD